MTVLTLQVQIGEGDYTADLKNPIDLSIPIRFNGQGLSAFGAATARKEAYRAGDFTGDVAAGGSCNCHIYTLNPHCQGTHTECVGHILENDIFIPDILPQGLMLAQLVTVQPVQAARCGESYAVELRPDDWLVTAEWLKRVIPAKAGIFASQNKIPACAGMTQEKALIIRTLPNPPEKTTRSYNETVPPFFSTQAMEYINRLGITHLLVDLPSIDRLDDGGGLSTHRIFWDIPAGIHRLATEKASQKTVTELIYAPDSVADGWYLLDLQVAPLMADAAPSRPLLYELLAED